MPRAHADCERAFSPCVQAETAPPNAFASELQLLPAPVRFDWRVGATFGFQTRTLLLQAASPDPLGREIVVVDDWMTSHLRAAARLSDHWAVAAQQPLSFGSSSEQTGSASSLAGGGVQPGLGDTELSLLLQSPAWPLLVSQRVSLPLGTARSFLRERGPSYAPSLALWLDRGTWILGALLGGHLRQTATFGDVRFGSELQLALGSAVRIDHASLALEVQALPSLTRDERRGQSTHSSLRRVPADWCLTWTQRLEPVRMSLGVGGSIPLTQRERTSLDASGAEIRRETEVLSGPPGASFRVRWGLDVEWR